jgi:hypothetical protein
MLCGSGTCEDAELLRPTTAQNIGNNNNLLFFSHIGIFLKLLGQVFPNSM